MQFSLSSKQFSFNFLYSYSLSIYFSRLSLLCPSVCLLFLLIGFTGVFQSLYTICTDQIRVINLFFFIPLPRVWSLQAPLLGSSQNTQQVVVSPCHAAQCERLFLQLPIGTYLDSSPQLPVPSHTPVATNLYSRCFCFSFDTGEGTYSTFLPKSGIFY